MVAGLCAAVLAVGLALSSPVRLVVGPAPLGLPGAETVTIPSRSGAAVRGWWVRGRGSGGGVVVLAHGVRGNRLQMAARAQTLFEHGFSVLLIDLQAHGESSGRRITFGKLEAMDADAAVSFVRERAPGERVGYVGVLLGGAAAVLGRAPLPVDALVLESVYPDIDAALGNRLRAGLGRVAGAVLAPVLQPAFELLLPPILGVTPSELRPLDHMDSVVAPVMILSGTEDDRTFPSEVEALFERVRTEKSIWLVPGAAHVDLEQYDPPAYWAHVLPFLRQTLQTSAGSPDHARR